MSHHYNSTYRGRNLERIAFPLGGIGAGMFCIEGGGGFSNFSLRHRPAVFNDPLCFSAISFPGASGQARLLAGPVPDWKIQFPWDNSAGNGAKGKDFGLPRCSTAEFLARFPFAHITLEDESLPVRTTVTAFSPFAPGHADESSLPVAAVEYVFENRTDKTVDFRFSFNAANFMQTRDTGARVSRSDRGFVLEQDADPEHPEDLGAFCAEIIDGEVSINPAWFRGGWFDSVTMLWNEIDKGAAVDREPHTNGPPSPGGSVSTARSLPEFGRTTVTLLVSWYVPRSTIQHGWRSSENQCCCSDEGPCGCYEPWYAGRFSSISDVADYWKSEYPRLRDEARAFSHTLFDTTIPPELIEAVSANLSILKSPTVLRQKDGRMWNYEGSCDTNGCCFGSCTHVWNYAQAVPHLFPDLERSLRETEFLVSQDERGHQVFRTPLPIRPTETHKSHAAADGQLGGIIKLYREWRISGDLDWLTSLWPAAKRSLDYCIETWDPDRTGLLIEPHHNTYDIEFWGPDGMCTTIYLAALEAATRIADALADDPDEYRAILDRGKRALDTELFDGEYYRQQIRWTGLRAGDPNESPTLTGNAYATEEARELLAKEGPKYQYGSGCLSDGVIGEWFALVAGLPPVADTGKVTSHLVAVHRHNFRHTLANHANPQRPTYALGDEAGLLLCSWPKRGEPHLPFVYSNEVWTGIEYQVASHLIASGRVTEGCEIVRACRDRYDGKRRNPFDEIECGHWYARALASYALLQAISGVTYDARSRTLTVAPQLPGNLKVFLAVEGGYGSVIVEGDEVRVEVISGSIPVSRIDYRRCPGT